MGFTRIETKDIEITAKTITIARGESLRYTFTRKAWFIITAYSGSAVIFNEKTNQSRFLQNTNAEKIFAQNQSFLISVHKKATEPLIALVFEY